MAKASPEGNELDEQLLEAVDSTNGKMNITDVRRLIEAGADVNARDGLHNTPLHLACSSGRADVVQLLLENGADPNARDNNGATPLHEAGRCEHIEIIRLLLDHGADINAEDDFCETVLHDACLYGSLITARCLLVMGAEVNARNEENCTPLDWTIAKLALDNPAREDLIELFREYAPDMVMEKFCTMSPGG